METYYRRLVGRSWIATVRASILHVDLVVVAAAVTGVDPSPSQFGPIGHGPEALLGYVRLNTMIPRGREV